MNNLLAEPLCFKRTDSSTNDTSSRWLVDVTSTRVKACRVLTRSMAADSRTEDYPHEIDEQLTGFDSSERIRTYMNKVKEITDKKKAARVDKGAAARFIRSALYEPDEKDPRKKTPSKKAADATPDAPRGKRPKQS
ncbi:Nuclear nucleic acid-binding protein C1D [Larimichthys crocea]|uniref:Uncharacterized protein n=1 Tax=Larimichthys crocea TaxID=215358 RepID=A0ACD3QCH2_LARCR|nr:Nuclear nucleic acid-binding protein C1D [Larimichthys crocea]